MNVSEKYFKQILKENPELCAAGMVPSTLGKKLQIDFDTERRRLEGDFVEFAACCDWLLDCTPLKHVSFVSPLVSELIPHLAEAAGATVSKGALIAAVIHMRIPYHHPADSPDVRIGISRRSPALSQMGEHP